MSQSAGRQEAEVPTPRRKSGRIIGRWFVKKPEKCRFCRDSRPPDPEEGDYGFSAMTRHAAQFSRSYETRRSFARAANSR